MIFKRLAEVKLEIDNIMVAIKAGTFSGTLKKGAKLGPHDIDNARGVIRDLVGRSITLKPTKTSHGQS